MTVAGVVLTGGASRRMGRTKPLVAVDGVRLADRVASALRGGGCDPVVAIGGDPDELAVLSVPVVPDRHPGHGPLGGILHGLELFGAVPADRRPAWMVAAACDLPDLTPAVVRQLTTSGTEAVDVVVARTDRLEPAVAMWSVSALAAVASMYERGEHALHRVIGGLRYVEIGVDAAALRNVNRPDDLHRRG